MSPTFSTVIQTVMFGLDPQSIADRVKAAGQPVRVPSLGESTLRGVIGFAVVSLLGFLPWVVAGGWLGKNVGETGLYATCLVAFLGSSGPFLHRLIIGPGSLKRFYQVFSLAFSIYAVVWTVAYMTLRGKLGGVVGALVGMMAMGGTFASAFGVQSRMFQVIAALFVSNLAGYFIGELAHNATTGTLAKAAWGVCYGLGFGAGIGFAFYLCQSEARRLIAAQRQ